MSELTNRATKAAEEIVTKYENMIPGHRVAFITAIIKRHIGNINEELLISRCARSAVRAWDEKEDKVIGALGGMAALKAIIDTEEKEASPCQTH